MTPILTVITPEIATKWLQHNTGNRKLQRSHVESYAKKIEIGEFQVTHQGISFSGSPQSPGRLLDGQTRLSAVVSCGIPIKQWVFWGADESTFSAIDGGKSRSFRDHYGWDKNLISTVGFFYSFRFNTTVPISKLEADMIREAIEPMFDMLPSTCVKKLSNAPVRCGFVMSMIENPSKAHEISAQYKYLIGSAFERMEPSVIRLHAKLIASLAGGKGGGHSVYCWARKASDPANFKYTKVFSPTDLFYESETESMKRIFSI